MKDITRHLTHYLSLLGIIAVALWGFLSFPYDKGFQTAIALALGAAFVVWGVVHHHIHEDLHTKVILEYVAMAVFGVVVLLAVIWRG